MNFGVDVPASVREISVTFPVGGDIVTYLLGFSISELSDAFVVTCAGDDGSLLVEARHIDSDAKLTNVRFELGESERTIEVTYNKEMRWIFTSVF